MCQINFTDYIIIITLISRNVSASSRNIHSFAVLPNYICLIKKVPIPSNIAYRQLLNKQLFQIVPLFFVYLSTAIYVASFSFSNMSAHQLFGSFILHCRLTPMKANQNYFRIQCCFFWLHNVYNSVHVR